MKTLQINKKGSMNAALSITMTVLAVAVLAVEIFGTDGLGSTALASAAPSWFVTIAPIAAGFALLGLLIRKK